MILKGSQRAGAKALAAHLTNSKDNDHVAVLQMRGFMADDLRGALSEIEAISKATQCKQYLFSLSLNPPLEGNPKEEDFLEVADAAEERLGLSGQPRAVIIHEKEGRRHAHVVWSRIDAESLTAINLSFFKQKLSALSKELYLEHGWSLPDGHKVHGGKNPLNFTRAEWQQAQRTQIDPREIKQVFRDAFERSDTLKALGNALAERGYFLAKGDRRGFVAVDIHGEVYSLPRWAGQKTRDVRAKFGKPDDLESVDAVKSAIRARLTAKLKTFIQQAKDKHADDLAPLKEERAAMVVRQRNERARLKAKQEARWTAEDQQRTARFRKGLRGVIDMLTGRARAIRKENEADVWACHVRDRDQRDDLAFAHLSERQVLQERFTTLRAQHAQDRNVLARDVTQFLRRAERASPSKDDATRPRGQHQSPPITSSKGRDHNLDR